jgi:hypothetical protein
MRQWGGEGAVVGSEATWKRGGGGGEARGEKWESFTYMPLKKVMDYAHATKKFPDTCVP